MSAPDVIELYRFVRGTTVWRYTSASEEVEYNGETYEPETISRTQDEQGEDINRADIQITVPRANAVAAEFIGYAPEQPMSFTVFRKVEDVVAVVAQGRITGCDRQNNVAQLKGESIITSMRRAGLSQRYQLNCRHFLYSSGCGLDPEDFKHTATVVGISGLNIELDDLSSFEDGWFRAGYVKTTNNEYRMILTHSGNVLTITAPIRGLEVSDSIDIHWGCAHTFQECNNKFGNIENFGGFPYIPTLNPFTKSVM